MAQNNQNSEKLTQRILSIMGKLLMVLCRVIVKSLLWIAKHFWKRYFDIETPIYRLWWKAHAKSMQKKLDRCHQIGYSQYETE